MTEVIKSFVDFFFNRNSKIRDKVILALSIVAVVLFVDFMLGFSHDYFIENKINKLEKLQRVLDSDKLTLYQRTQFTQLQNQVLADNRSLSQDEHDELFYSVWYFISFGGLMAAFALFVLINQLIAFSPAIAVYSLRERILQAFWAIGILFALTVILAVFAWLFAYIPSRPVAQLLSLFLQCVFIYAIFLAFGKSNQIT